MSDELFLPMKTQHPEEQNRLSGVSELLLKSQALHRLCHHHTQAS